MIWNIGQNFPYLSTSIGSSPSYQNTLHMDDNEVHHQYTHVHIDYICNRRFLDDIHIVQSYDRIGASKIHMGHNRKLEKRLFEFFLQAKLNF